MELTKNGARQRAMAYSLLCVLAFASLPIDSLGQQSRPLASPSETPQQRQRRVVTHSPQRTPPATTSPTPAPTPVPSTNSSPAPAFTPTPTSVASTSSLDEFRLRVREVLDQPSLASSFAGVKIVSLDSGRTLFEENSRKLLNPASNMKLFTVAAALARLSPDYRITTSVYVPARPDPSGTVRGDMRVYGRGDPTYAKRFTKTDARAAIDELAARIQAAGVRRVEGDLIADESYFAGAPLGRGWEWDDLQWYYGAEVSALSVGDNAVDLVVSSGAQPGSPCFVSSSVAGAPIAMTINTPADAVAASSPAGSEVAASAKNATITSAPKVTAMSGSPEPFLQIINRATTAPRGALRTLRVFRPLNSNVIEITGQLPQGGANFSGSVAVSHPAMLFALMLHDSLQKRGIAFAGTTRAVSREDAGFVPVQLTSLVEIASRQSPPLSVIARETMKPSQNLYTELLLRQLAAPLNNAQPAMGITAENGLESLSAFLRGAGIADDGVVPVDGSGLSRGDFVTPDAVVRLLTFMDKHPYRVAYRDALPIAGVDGTLSNRLKGTRAAGNLIAKTGTLSTATSLSGYVTSRGGERLVFSLIINNYTSDVDARSRFTDLIAVLLADFGGRS